MSSDVDKTIGMSLSRTETEKYIPMPKSVRERRERRRLRRLMRDTNRDRDTDKDKTLQNGIEVAVPAPVPVSISTATTSTTPEPILESANSAATNSVPSPNANPDDMSAMGSSHQEQERCRLSVSTPEFDISTSEIRLKRIRKSTGPTPQKLLEVRQAHAEVISLWNNWNSPEKNSTTTMSDDAENQIEDKSQPERRRSLKNPRFD